MAQIAAGLAVDPVGHVDPALDLVGPLAVPGQVFGEVPVALGRIDAKALQHVDADLFLLGIDRDASRRRRSARPCRSCRPLRRESMYQVWWLMPEQTIVESSPRSGAEHLGDLRRRRAARRGRGPMVSHLAVFVRRPGVHRHRVGVVEEQRAGCGDLADVLAEVEDDRDVALAIQDAAGADRVADALVDAVFQRDADVVREGLEPADADAADDVAGACESASRRSVVAVTLAGSLLTSTICSMMLDDARDCGR